MFVRLTASELLEKCHGSTVKAGGVLFQYAPNGAPRPDAVFKCTIPRAGYAYLTGAEICAKLGAGAFDCEVMR